MVKVFILFPEKRKSFDNLSTNAAMARLI